MVKAKVYVTLKPSVLDPQGKVIMNALHTLGHTQITEVRASKFFEITFDTDDEIDVTERLEAICDKVLANPNTEAYYYELSK